jgi:hypothetical protein
MQQDFINHFVLVQRNPMRIRTDVVPSSRTFLNAPTGRTYTCIEGEKFRDVSFNVYGEEHYWWAIADANQNIDLNEGLFGLSAGVIIVVPDKSEFLL